MQEGAGGGRDGGEDLQREESGAVVHWEPRFIVSPQGSPYTSPTDACYSINHTDVSQ